MEENYAIQKLKEERNIIKKALIGWPENEYEEARKLRLKRIKQLDEAIKLIEVKEHGRTFIGASYEPENGTPN